MKKTRKQDNSQRKILLIQRAFRQNQSGAGIRAAKIYDEYCRKHHCTSCASCCKTLGPRITRSDVNELAKYLGMKAGEAETAFFRFDEDGDRVFKSMPCPFLQPDNLCSVYEARPRACRQYPHIQEEDFYSRLDLHAKNYFCCPAVRTVIDKMASDS